MKRNSVIILCCAVLVACQPEDSHLFFTDIPYPVTLPQPGDDLRLELVREYGDRDRGLVFGQIGRLAVSETGTLGVLDAMECRIWIVDTHTGEGKILGGCGDGPGEFREFRAVAFTGDTLVVFDSGRMSMVKITLEGEEIGRFHTPLSDLGALGISDLHIGHRGSILAGLDLMPNRMSSEHFQVVSFDSFGGAVNARGLVAPPIARTTALQIVRRGSLCVGMTEEDGEVVVAVNPWGPQIALLRKSDFEPLLSARVPIHWAQTREHDQGPNYWGPMSPGPEAACGERYAVIGYRRQINVSRGVSDVLSAVMVVIDIQDGSMTVLGGDEPPESGSILFMTPGTATGDRYFFFTNSFFDYPVIREYRIVRTPE